MGWLKLYYRDNQKVMRAIEGVRILVDPGSDPVMIYLDESVYTLESHVKKCKWIMTDETCWHCEYLERCG